MWIQKYLQLRPLPRGFHLITHEIEKQLPELSQISVGLLHLFIQHTSASLTLNENADPSVRQDFEAWFNRNVRENESYYTHLDEGSDEAVRLCINTFCREVDTLLLWSRDHPQPFTTQR